MEQLHSNPPYTCVLSNYNILLVRILQQWGQRPTDITNAFSLLETIHKCNGSSEARTSFDGWQQILQENIMGKTWQQENGDIHGKN